MGSTRLGVGTQARPEGPRTTARPPPVAIGPGAGAPDPRALGLPPTAAPARSPASASMPPARRPAASTPPARDPNSPTIPPRRRLAQTLQGTGVDEMRALNRPVPAAPRRASMPPGPSPAAREPSRPIVEQELTDPDAMVYAQRPAARPAAREEPDEATHYLQRPAMPPAPLPNTDDDADPTRVISRHDLPAQSGRTPLMHLPPVAPQPRPRGQSDPDEEPTRLIGSQSWPPSDMAMPGPAMPVSDPPPVPTVVLKKNVAHKPTDVQPPRDNRPAGEIDQAPFVPPEDVDAPPEVKGLAFRTVSSAPLRPGVTAQPSVVIVDSLHNDTTEVSKRRGPFALAFGAALAKHRDKLVLFGAGTLAGMVLFGLGFVLGTSGRSAPAAPPAATTEAKPRMPAPPPPPPPAAEPKPAEPVEQPALAASAAAPEPPTLPTPSSTGRSITSLALEPPTAADKRARTRTVVEPRKTTTAPVKTEHTATATPAPAPAPTTAKREPDPEPAFPEPKAPAPAAAPKKGYVSPIQAPGF